MREIIIRMEIEDDDLPLSDFTQAFDEMLTSFDDSGITYEVIE